MAKKAASANSEIFRYCTGKTKYVDYNNFELIIQIGTGSHKFCRVYSKSTEYLYGSTSRVLQIQSVGWM